VRKHRHSLSLRREVCLLFAFLHRETVQKLCNGVSPGGGRILECLRTNRRQIADPACLSALFPLQQSVDQDGGLDLYLVNQCQLEIKTFCPAKVLREGGGDGTLITCLKLNTHQEVHRHSQQQPVYSNVEKALLPVLIAF